eukprot:scaffold303717_cov73-Attheya_sp.AAC.2
MSSQVAETNADTMEDMVATVDVEATWADPKMNHHKVTFVTSWTEIMSEGNIMKKKKQESENGQEGVHENILQVNTLI